MVTLQGLSRRAALAGALTIGAGPRKSRAAQPGSVVRLGILTDLNGPYAGEAGRGVVEAVHMAADDMKPQLGDRTVHVAVADHQNTPDTGLTIARGWIDGGIDAIVHVPNSAIALAVQGLTRERKTVFLITGGTSDALTGSQCSPYSAHWVDDTYTLSHGVANAMLRDGGDTWYFIAVDYAFGRALVNGASDAIEAAGGRVVGVSRTPLGTADFSSCLLQAQSSGAKVVALALAGDDLVNAVKQAHEFGLAAGAQKLVGMATNTNEIDALGLATAQGLRVVCGFYWDRTDGTRAWSQQFRSRAGHVPTKEQAASYSAVGHYLRAVADQDTTDAGRVIERMKSVPVADFYGDGARLRADGRLLAPVFLWRVKAPGESRYASDDYAEVERLPDAVAYRRLDQGQCPFIGH
jgi:branched-chain amino acid transport system substrate-binding protein